MEFHSTELSEYLLSGHQHLYKNRTRDTGADLKTTQRQRTLYNRREKRDNILFNNRKIDCNLSPITPATQKKKTPSKKGAGSKMDDESAEMLRRLAKWKEEREKMKLKQKKSKPIFKVSRVTAPVGLPNLDLVNKQIKGKIFNTTTVQRPKSPESKTKQSARTPNRRQDTVKTNKTPIRRQDTVKTNKTPKSTKKTPLRKQNTDPTISTSSNKTPIQRQKTLPAPKSTNKTPIPKQNLETTPEVAQVEDRPRTPPYISPYVTVSRGKRNARYEYEIRTGKKEFNPDIMSENTLRLVSPQACANYFEHVLNEEIKRLECVCQVWEEIRESNEVPEDANDMIDVAIGQTKLLISQKFQQFRKLIDECRRSRFTEMPIKNEDLHGFWDMVFIQVHQLNERFQNLERIKNNNWEEILPDKKIVKKVQKPRASKAKASSKLREMIKERKKTLAQNNENGMKDNCVPLIKLNNNSITSSPGLKIMNLSASIKRNNGLTPSKRNAGKTPKSAKKTVCFQDDKDNKENNVELDMSNNKNNVITPRRSLRLIRKSLTLDL